MTSTADNDQVTNITPNLINVIPTRIRQKERWAVYRKVENHKKPWDIDKLCALSWSDSSKLISLENVIELFTAGSALPKHHHKHVDGIGYVFPPIEKEVFEWGADLDKCVDGNGTISATAVGILNDISSYSELSPSKTGVHALAWANVTPEIEELLGDKNNLEFYIDGQHIELFCGKHFITVTADRLTQYPADMEERTEVLTELLMLSKLPENQPPEESRSDDTRKKHYVEAALHGEVNRVQNARVETRNSTLNKAAYNLGGYVQSGAIDESEIERDLARAAKYAGLEQSEIMPTIRSGLEAGKRRPRNIPEPEQPKTPRIKVELDHTSLINGEPGHRKLNEPDIALQVLENTLLLKIEDQKDTFAFYDGRKYVIGIAAENYIERTMQRVVTAVDDELEEDVLKLLTKTVRNNVWGHISTMTEMIPTGEFDPYNDLLCCNNGVIYLKTGKLLPHSPAYRMRAICNVNYNPNAEAPLFIEFLEKILPKVEIREYLQKLLGSMLSGDRKEQAFYIWWGEKDNGKSVLAKVVTYILGEYAFNAPVKAFLLHQQEPLLPEIAQMAPARGVFVGELPRNKSWNEPLIKAMTAGDEISARLLHKLAFSYVPKYKIVMHTNHIPTTETVSPSMMKRVRIVPFDVIIPPEEQDPELPDKLKAEAEGILTWMVDGCIKWYAEGMKTPDWMNEEIESYRIETDPLSGFPEERLVKKVGSKIQASTLYEVYKAYMETIDEDPVDQKAFSQHMSNRGYKKVPSGGRKYYKNIDVEKAGKRWG